MKEQAIPVRSPSFRSPQTPTEERVFTLIKEVKDLFEQYRREVPSKRRPWPESIRKRIISLWAMGVSSHQIGAETGVSIQTLYSWRQRIKKQSKNDGFTEIPVIGRKRRTQFQIQQDDARHSSELQLSQLKSLVPTSSNSGITITLLSGTKVEGLSFEQVLKVLSELGH